MTQELWNYMFYPRSVTFVWWGAVWLMVLAYYVSASARQWSHMYPARRTSPLTLFARGMGYTMFAGLQAVRGRRFGTPTPADQMPYPPGMLLQLGIACSALCSAGFGLTGWSLDRVGYPGWRMAFNILMTTISTVGGVVHLYVPLRDRVALWRSMMLFTWIVVPAGYAVAGALYLLR